MLFLSRAQGLGLEWGFDMKRIVFIVFVFLFIFSCSLPMYDEELIKTLVSIESMGMEKLGETDIFGVDWETEVKDISFYPVRDEEHITYGVVAVKRDDSNVSIRMLGSDIRHVYDISLVSDVADNLEILVGKYNELSTNVAIMYVYFEETSMSNFVSLIGLSLNFKDMSSMSWGGSGVSLNNPGGVSFFPYIDLGYKVAGYFNGTNEYYNYSLITDTGLPSSFRVSSFPISNPINLHYELFSDSTDLSTNPPTGYISYEDGKGNIKLFVVKGSPANYQDAGTIPGHVIDVTPAGRIVLYNPDEKMYYIYNKDSLTQIAAVEGSLVNYCGEYEIGTRKKLVFSIASVFETKNGKAASLTLYAYEP